MVSKSQLSPSPSKHKSFDRYWMVVSCANSVRYHSENILTNFQFHGQPLPNHLLTHTHTCTHTHTHAHTHTHMHTHMHTCTHMHTRTHMHTHTRTHTHTHTHTHTPVLQDFTLLHVPIEDQVYSLTDENGAHLGAQNNANWFSGKFACMVARI